MSKRALLNVIDARPAVHNGELVSATTVVQVSQLAMTAPYSGDFQIVDNGRLIVGDHPDLGDRVIVGKFGMFGYDPDGINTFAVLSKQAGPWGSGDVFAGYVSGNFLHFDQSAGTLGVYSPAGAGFIAGADGSLYAGDMDGAHMRWNTATRAIEVRNGEDVKISLDTNGDAMFDGTVYAQGGRIYGLMQVDGLFRAGNVDGPAISLGRFERLDGSTLVESSEIIATDASNMPWFHVTAGGSTAGGGWFHLGGSGDYPQRLTYDGANLVFDGTLYARGGSISGDMTIGGDMTITTGSLITDSVIISQSGITFDALTGKYDGAGLKWVTGTVEYFRVGTQIDLGDVVGTILESDPVDMTITAPNVYIMPHGGGSVVIGASSGYSEAGSNFTSISENGSINTVGTATATFANGIIGPTWKPASDSTTALQMQNAAGTAILTVDTTNSRVGIGGATSAGIFLNISPAYSLGTATNALQLVTNNSGVGDIENINSVVFSNHSSGTRGKAVGVTTGIWQVDNGVLSEAICLDVTGLSKFAGSVGDLYGLRINGIAGAAGANYALYINGGVSYHKDSFGIGTTAPDSKLHAHLDDAATSAASQLLTLSHNTSGTVANGFGSRVLWELESSTTADQSAAALDVAWAEKTHGSRAARMTLSAYDASGAREGLRIEASGSAPMVSLYGVAAIARPTTSYGTATFTANSGTAVNDASTFDGYTLKQVVKALRDIGILT